MLAGTAARNTGFAQKQKRVTGPYLTLPDSPLRKLSRGYGVSINAYVCMCVYRVYTKHPETTKIMSSQPQILENELRKMMIILTT